MPHEDTGGYVAPLAMGTGAALGFQLCTGSRQLLNVPVLRSVDQTVNSTDANS